MERCNAHDEENSYATYCTIVPPPPQIPTTRLRTKRAETQRSYEPDLEFDIVECVAHGRAKNSGNNNVL